MYGKCSAILLSILLAACQTPQVPQPPQLAAPVVEAPEVSLAPSQESAREPAGEMSLPPVDLELTPIAEEEPAAPSLTEEIVDYYLRQLTLPQMIGQRLISGIPGTKVTERSRRLLREGYLGGILLTRQNVAGREQLKRFIVELQEIVRQNSPAIGLLVAVDQEGGRVSRLDVDELSRFPPPHFWATYGDPYYIEAVAYITAREALELGCNLNLAPVLDLYALPDATVIGDRSMGADAAQVAVRGLAYLAGARKAGMAAAVKHFPGHGRTTTDTHQKLAVLEVDEETLWEQDLLPFRLAVEDGVEAIMTAHILYPRLDPAYPVTLSETIVRGLLRGKLGFDGVVLSDDIEMGALAKSFTTREILKRSILAGVDIILAFGGLDALKLIAEVKALVESGELTREQIEEGVRRVLRLKARCGLLPA